MYKTIRPGKVWYDTDGKRIQAHGGSIIFLNGLFYWYGENKEGITGRSTGEQCPFWHHGVRFYSSSDLCNWKDEGLLIQESDDPQDPFYPKNIMDRPHIIYNEATKKFVLWAKTSKADFGSCSFSVYEGSSLGGLAYVHDVNLGSFHAGDFDLFAERGTAYIIFENPHTSMVCAELSHDYLSFSSHYSIHLEEECPPFIREAPAYFKRGGRRYLLTSGTTGYYPNRSKCYDITNIHGDWDDLGFTCQNDNFKTSFFSQFSSVFLHPSIPDLYIALGDRWLTDLVVDLPDMDQAFYDLFSKHGDKKRSLYSDNLSDENTSEANYVWLPISFDEKGRPSIIWQREWSLSDYGK